MKKVTSALALAALVGTPAAAMANVEFGGDFDARYYNLQDAEDSNASGFDQRIRLQSSFETDGGVSVNARLNLMNDRWTGDASGQNLDDAPFNGRGNRNVELDYGFASLPMFGGMVNIGRQESNWNPMGLTTTDDRRDRISYVRPLGGGHTAIVAYDRRQASVRRDGSTEGNQPFVALLGPLAEGVQYGLLVAYWEASSSGADGDGYVLNGATLVSPYIEGQAGDFNYGAGVHYLGDGRNLYQEDTFAGYLHAGFQMTPEFKLEGQLFHAADGALVAGGYDSYSSLINNSPDHNQSATSIAALNLSGLAGRTSVVNPSAVAGGADAESVAGTEAQDGMSRTLAAVRGTYTMMDWTFMGALGWVNYEDPDLTGVAGDALAASGQDEDVIFVDAQVHYQLTPSTRVFGTAGYADVEEDQFGRDDFWASSVNLNVQF